MRLKNILIKITSIVVFITFLSCDNDFNSVGNEVIGGVNFEDNQYSAVPIAYSKKIKRANTNSLIREVKGTQTSYHANLLGVYDDPTYGQSVYSILSQVQPTKFNPNFGTNAVLDSVVLSLPYFSTVTSTEPVTISEGVTETRTLYRLDSVYGNQPFKLSVYKSDYFLRDFSPESNERQLYYSDDVKGFETKVVNGKTPLYTTDAFTPSNKEIVIEKTTTTNGTTTTTRERQSPRMRVTFSDDVKALFKTLFLDKQGSSELSNANNFRNYFRGIYIKAEPVNSGNLVYVNTRGANITLYYSFDSTTNSVTTRKQGEFSLGFSNNIIGGIETDFKSAFVENQDVVNGEDNLYLKGGDGSYAVLDLFSRYVQVDENGDFVLDENKQPIFIDTPTTPTDKDKTELDFLKSRDWLVNDASIKFYINQGEGGLTSGGDVEPERIFVFNLETGAPVSDYFSDINDASKPLNSIVNHLGRISRGTDKSGEFYKIRLTQHIINILNSKIDNVKLGVSVSQNVNTITTTKVDTPNTKNETIPTSSIVSHEGTILYGNKAVPEAKRLKLDIFYTASKTN
ncbi:DUF4270 domain-containing protein [Aquimarina longa]|uniref:DUF4270 domain-containing protein n=1 Tax=Aquimarina longa TaxID=1080221 RepID=UPI0007854D6C|nr:DUF4270 domain-containing protein [Aquimarina longa]